MSIREWKRAGLLSCAGAVFVGASMSLTGGSAAAATTNPVVLTPVTQAVADLDAQYQLCVLEHDLDLQIAWIASYPSQPPVPGFCVPQQPGETGLANSVLPIIP